VAIKCLFNHTQVLSSRSFSYHYLRIKQSYWFPV